MKELEYDIWLSEGSTFKHLLETKDRKSAVSLFNRKIKELKQGQKVSLDVYKPIEDD